MEVAGTPALRLASAHERVGCSLPVIIFDGDDTLWRTEPLYDEARGAAAQVVMGFGVDPLAWEGLQRRTDLANVGRFGLSAERFPTSCVEAFLELASRTGLTAGSEEIRAVESAASSVFERVAPLVPHAEEVLSDLQRSHRLILLTQGDPRVQRKRVLDSGLAGWFDEALIAATKSAQVLAGVVDHFRVPHDRSWMVGNSLPSDINPAVAAGMRAIWIDAHVWEHERREALQLSDLVFVAESISDVPSIVSQLELHDA